MRLPLPSFRSLHVNHSIHRMMAHAAVFMANDGTWTRFFETIRDLGDLSRYEHQVDVGAIDVKSVQDVHARCDERDLRARGDTHFRRHEGPDLAEHHDLVGIGSGLTHAGRIEWWRRGELGGIDLAHPPG